MIESPGNRHFIACPMVMDHARQLSEKAATVLQGDSACFDLSRVEMADSSAIAVMLGVVREAQAKGVAVSFANVPQGVLTLARLYKLDDQLAVV